MAQTQKRKLPFTYPEFLQIYSNIPRLCVDLLIKTEQGILYLKRDIEPFPGTWHLPGGTVFFQDTIEQTIIRLAYEELGLKLKKSQIGPLIGFIQYPDEIREQKPYHSVSLVFEINLNSTEVKQSETIKLFSKIPPNTFPHVETFIKKIS